MTIGRFAQLSGLSIHALRHYDDIGLLEPEVVDADTGYRRYRRGQIPQARLISSLRWIDLPIDEIRQVLGDQTATEEVLDRHRKRLTRHANLLAARLADIKFTEEGLPMPEVVTAGCVPVQIKIAVSDATAAVQFYRAAFGMKYEVTRRTDEEQYSGFVFGESGSRGSSSTGSGPAPSGCWSTTWTRHTNGRSPPAPPRPCRRAKHRACRDRRR